MKVLYRLFAFILAVSYLVAPAAITYAATPKPTCSITVTPTSIKVGGSVTVKWTSTNATAGAITNIGNVGPKGSINLLPSSASVTTYFGAFTGPGGTTNCQATVAVSSASGGGGSASSGADRASGGTDSTSGKTSNPVNVGSAISINNTQSSNSNSGLVPCGYGAYNGNGADQGASTGCQACNLVQLVQRLMNFAIGIAIPIAAALFAYAGVLYFTSASKPGNIEKAKGIFKNALIGFVIAIAAWVIINTFLTILFSGSSTVKGSWFSIQCATGNRPVNNKITDVLSKLPIVAGSAGAIQQDGGGVSSSGGTTDTGGGGTTCNSGFQYDVNSGTCYNATTDTIQYPTGGSGGGGGTGSASYNNTLDALTSNCDANGGAACAAANEFADTGRMSTAIQNVLDDACGDGSAASCNAAIPVTGSGTMGASGSSIASAALSYRGTETSEGPGGGRVACAWAVNNVLASDGIAPIDGNSVAGMEQQLQSGRGTSVATSDAQAGDIIIWKTDTVSHVGICEEAGCATALSNSSSNAAFTNVSGPTLLGVPGRVYRVNQ